MIMILHSDLQSHTGIRSIHRRTAVYN